MMTRSLCSHVTRLHYSDPQATCDDGRKPERELILHELKFTGTEISRGTYGRVVEVEYEGTLCAAKEVMHSPVFDQSDERASVKILQDSFLSKCQIWRKLHHPCIIKFIGLVFLLLLYRVYNMCLKYAVTTSKRWHSLIM